MSLLGHSNLEKTQIYMQLLMKLIYFYPSL